MKALRVRYHPRTAVCPIPTLSLPRPSVGGNVAAWLSPPTPGVANFSSCIGCTREVGSGGGARNECYLQQALHDTHGSLAG